MDTCLSRIGTSIGYHGTHSADSPLAIDLGNTNPLVDIAPWAWLPPVSFPFFASIFICIKVDIPESADRTPLDLMYLKMSS